MVDYIMNIKYNAYCKEKYLFGGIAIVEESFVFV